MTWKRLFPFQSTFHQLADGRKIHVAANGDGFPVLMIHGNPTWSFMFRRLLRDLPEHGFRALAMDQLGCGLSDKPQDGDYTLAGHLSNLEFLIREKLKLAQFDLVLHDWGGPVGFAFAARYPHMVRKIVAMNTVAWADSRIPKAIYLTKCPFLGAWLVRSLNLLMKIALDIPLRKLSPEVREGFLFPYGNYHDRIAIQRFPQDIPLSPRHPSAQAFSELERGLGNLRRHPVLICWGEQDRCFPINFLETWKERLPQVAIKRFPMASHFLLEDQPDEVAETIAKFLTV